METASVNDGLTHSRRHLTALEAGAIRNAVWRNSVDGGIPFPVAVGLLSFRVKEDTAGELNPAEFKPDIPGDAGAMFWFVSLCWHHWQFLRRSLSPDEAAETQLAMLRDWHRGLTGSEWGNWQPPAAEAPAPELLPCLPDPAEDAPQIEEAGAERRAVGEDDDARIPGLPQQLRDLASRCLPDPLPQPTMQEARAMGQAVSPAARSARWLTDQYGDECHFKPDRDMTAVLDIRALRGLDKRNENLACVLSTLGDDAPMLALGCISLVREIGGPIRGIPLDALVGFLGWSPATKAELLQMRATVWRWLQVFSNLQVWGARRGYYTQPGTRERRETISRDPLIVVLGEERDTSNPENPVPVSVTIQPGDWFRGHLGDARALPFFGNLNDLTPLPPGEPSGSLARNIAKALNQLWRQEAAKPGAYAFTRSQLLRLFGGDELLRPVLTGRNPMRAREYWDRAIALLKQLGIVGYYAEVDNRPLPRKGWRDVWLRQPLEIRPGARDTKAIEMIAAANNRRAAAISARGNKVQ